jgi:hypothetical protein
MQLGFWPVAATPHAVPAYQSAGLTLCCRLADLTPLASPLHTRAAKAGDGRHPDALDGLDPSIRQMLWDQEWFNITKVTAWEKNIAFLSRQVLIATSCRCSQLPLMGNCLWELGGPWAP